MTIYDVGIAGLGAMGSMTALELARRGQRVIGFDRFHPPHAFGSSTGKSRIIREAYFEHPQYVPLVQRAYQRWSGLEGEAGERLLIPTGGVMIGQPQGTLVAGARRSAIEHRLEYEELGAEALARRFPMFLPAPSEVGLWEPRAGVLRPEAAIALALRLAQAAGAVLRYREPVVQWRSGETITVETAAGGYQVRRLILSAGAWLAGSLSHLKLPLTVARQTLFWFPADAASGMTPDRMPIFIWEWAKDEMFYGFPDLGDGVKVAIHHQGVPTDPDRVERGVLPGEADRLRGVLATRMPALSAPPAEMAVCLYTNTPDGDFLIDRLPGEPRVILASPCSGHGFKFAPALAEVLADLTLDRTPGFDLAPFRLRWNG